MAWMNQEKKAKIAAAVKAVNARYPDLGVRYGLSVQNHMAITMRIRSANVDLIANAIEANPQRFGCEGRDEMIRGRSLDVNPYHLEKQFHGTVLEYFQEIVDALNTDNHNRSDIMTDYYDVGHYINIRIGDWDKAFVIREVA